MSDEALEAFKLLERTGWGKRAETYDLLTGRITARLVDPLLDAAAVRAGARVLDVGTGPGHAAAAAARRGALATGVDIADELLAVARRRHPESSFLRADAEELPFDDDSFDALVANFAINHLPRPERAVREFARVLAPRGGIALSAWDRPERNRFLGVLVDALREYSVGGPPGPDQYRFADDEEFRALLSDAGWGNVEVLTIGFTHTASNPEELWLGLMGGSVRTAGLVAEQPAPVRSEIRAAFERNAEAHLGEAGLELPVSAKIALGRMQ